MHKFLEEQQCVRIDKVEERTLLVVTAERGRGIKEDLSRLVELYYEKDKEGIYRFLYVKDSQKEKEQF